MTAEAVGLVAIALFAGVQWALLGLAVGAVLGAAYALYKNRVKPESSVIIPPVLTPKSPLITQQVLTPKSPLITQQVITPKSPLITQQVITPKSPIITQPVMTPKSPLITQPVMTPKSPLITQPVMTPKSPLITQPVMTPKSEAPEISQQVMEPPPKPIMQEIPNPEERKNVLEELIKRGQNHSKFSKVKSFMHGKAPDFKIWQSRLILDTVIQSLADRIKFGKIEFETDNDELLNRHLEQVVAEIAVQYKLSSCDQNLCKALVILFNLDGKYQDPTLQLADLMKILSEVKNDSVLAQAIAHALFTVPQWDLFVKIAGGSAKDEKCSSIAESVEGNKVPESFSALYVERFKEKDIPVYRFPSPEKGTLGAFALFVADLKANDLRHCWFGHQANDSKGIPELSTENPKTLYYFNLPVEGRIFNQTHPVLKQDVVAADAFKELVVKSILESAEGFHFPEGLKNKEELNRFINEVSDTFFPGKLKLSKEERQTFLLLFYTKVEREFPLKLAASRNSTSKDGLDALCYYVDLIGMGKQNDSASLYNFRIILHHLAKKPGKLLINTLKYLEGLEHFKAGNCLESVEIPSVKVRHPCRISEAKNPLQFLKAVDAENPNQQMKTWQHFVEKNLHESPSFLKKTVPVASGETVPHQILRDIKTMGHKVNGMRVQGDTSEDALQNLYDSLSQLTNNDRGQILRIISCHSQAIISEISMLLGAHYQYNGDSKDDLDKLMLRPRKVGEKNNQVEVATRKYGNEYQTFVTVDYEIGTQEKTERLIRAELKIDHRGKFTPEDYEASFKHDDEVLDNGVLAPDAILTWKVGSEEEFPQLTRI